MFCGILDGPGLFNSWSLEVCSLPVHLPFSLVYCGLFLSVCLPLLDCSILLLLPTLPGGFDLISCLLLQHVLWSYSITLFHQQTRKAKHSTSHLSLRCGCLPPPHRKSTVAWRMVCLLRVTYMEAPMTLKWKMKPKTLFLLRRSQFGWMKMMKMRKCKLPIPFRIPPDTLKVNL